LISYYEFKKHYRILDEDLKAVNVSWEELCSIYNDYEEKKSSFEGVLDSFLEEYFSPAIIRKHNLKIHSIGSRVKDSEHLIEKLIRRKKENAKKYSGCDLTNYLKFITDIAGIRILLVYKADWENIHDYIINSFENDEKNYIKKSIEDFDEDTNHTYIAEPPKVHIRTGDCKDIYTKVLPPDRVIEDRTYRSAHYIIKYQGIYIEIQVRTLFEEGWGEVDHSILYPTNKDNYIYKEYTELLNRLSGLADEMSSFFVTLKDVKAGVDIVKEEKDDQSSIIDAGEKCKDDKIGDSKDELTFIDEISRVVRKR